MKKRSIDFIPLGIEALPLANAPPDEEHDNYTIQFRSMTLGRVKAIVYDDRNYVVDVVVGHSFLDTYDKVREEYPQASWSPD